MAAGAFTCKGVITSSIKGSFLPLLFVDEKSFPHGSILICFWSQCNNNNLWEVGYWFSSVSSPLLTWLQEDLKAHGGSKQHIINNKQENRQDGKHTWSLIQIKSPVWISFSVYDCVWIWKTVGFTLLPGGRPESRLRVLINTVQESSERAANHFLKPLSTHGDLFLWEHIAERLK